MLSTGRGFTLIEMLIVLSLVGLAVMITAPRIHLARYRVDSGMLGVATTLVAAQRVAVTRQHDVIIAFDVTQAAIRVHRDADNDGVVDTGERLRDYPLGEHVRFGRGSAPARLMGPDAVTFTKRRNGLPALTFHRNGSASEARGFYLTSTREAATGAHPEDSRAIEVDRATGRVSWYRYGPPAWRRGF